MLLPPSLSRSCMTVPQQYWARAVRSVGGAILLGGSPQTWLCQTYREYCAIFPCLFEPKDNDVLAIYASSMPPQRTVNLIASEDALSRDSVCVATVRFSGFSALGLGIWSRLVETISLDAHCPRRVLCSVSCILCGLIAGHRLLGASLIPQP